MKKTSDKQKRVAYVDVTAELFISAIQKHYKSTLPDDAEVIKVEIAPQPLVFDARIHGHTIRLFLCSKEFGERQEGEMMPCREVIVEREKREIIQKSDMLYDYSDLKTFIAILNRELLSQKRRIAGMSNAKVKKQEEILNIKSNIIPRLEDVTKILSELYLKDSIACWKSR